MNTSDFDYNLPQELIAQKPVENRDQSRLFVVDKEKKIIEHKSFYNIINFLKKGDLIVWNNSKVFKARLFGFLEPTDKDINKDGIKDKGLLNSSLVEIFLVKPMENEGVWQVLGKPGRRLKIGMRVRFASDFYCDILIKNKEGDLFVQFEDNENIVRKKANQYGHIPVPPYVKDEPHELEIYQTVYAKHEGSVAAPTAGFHFTEELIEKIKNKGIEFAEVTLHVGLGTFLPVKSERVEDHTMHSEWIEITEETAKKINQAKEQGRRIIAVGTTTVRTLEGVAKMFNLSADRHDNVTMKQCDNDAQKFKYIHPYTGDINLFITPGFEFQIVDVMITNFHLPKSTLLMLVSAFAGDREFMLNCYKIAVENKYRFYSFGDAMFIK